MIRIASSLASGVRSANNSVRPILSWRRSGAAEYIEPCVDKVLRYKLNELKEEGPILYCSTPSLLLQVEHFKFSKFGNIYHDVLCRHLDSEIKKELEAGVDPCELQTGIDMALEVVKKYLKQRARMVNSFEEIAQIATIATNRDGKIGGLVAKAMKKIKKDDFIMISDERKSSNVLEFMNAVKIKWGCLSPYFYDVMLQQKCVLEDPCILIYENKILNKDFVKQAIELAKQPVLIIAEDVNLEVVGSLMLDRTCLKTKVCVVRVPKSQENRKAVLEDLAILTGGQVVTERSSGSFIPLMLGSCKEVRVSSHDTIMLGGLGNLGDIEQRREQLRSEIKRSTSDNEVNMLKERLVNLSRNLAIFKVRGSKFYIKKRIFDAINAVKLAKTEGIIPGGGVALLHASKGLDKLQTSTSGSKIAVQHFQNALKMPVYTIACAAGFDGSVAVEKILKQENPDLGYDPASGEYVDMMMLENFDILARVLINLNYVKGVLDNVFHLHHHRKHKKGKSDGIGGK